MANKRFGQVPTNLEGQGGAYLKVKEDESGFEFQKTEPIGDWITSYAYYVGDLVQVDLKIYRCKTQHTSSSSFAADSANWDEVSSEIDPVFLARAVTTGHYTGFVNRTTSTLGFVDGTRTFTLSPSGTLDVYVSGSKYTLASPLTVVITNTTALYWVWLTAPSGTPQLNMATSFPGFDKCLIASIYWNATTGKGIVSDERHWMGRDKALHEYLHETIGTRYSTGLAGTFAAGSFSVGSGEIHDEDLDFAISTQTTCKVFYKNGSADWEWDANNANVYKLNGSIMRYNNGNALADVPNNNFVAMWVFATNNVSEPIAVVIGQRVDSSIGNARANATPDTLSYGSLPSAEMKLLYRVIYKQTATPQYQETADYRTTSNLPVSNYTATDHSTLSKLAFSQSGHTWDADVDLGANNLSTTGLVTCTGTKTSVRTVSSPTTLDNTYNTVLVSGNTTISLPTAVGISGKVFEIKKTDSSGTTTTISPNGAETIDSRTVLYLINQGAFVSIKSDGTNWQIINSLYITPPAELPEYTISNLTVDRSFDANNTSINELADIVGTLATDFAAVSGVNPIKRNVFITTTNATQTVAATYTPNGIEVKQLRIKVSARLQNTGVNKSYWAVIECGVRRNNSGSAALVGTRLRTDDSEGSPGYTCDVGVSGNDLRVLVTGASSETVEWSVVIDESEVNIVYASNVRSISADTTLDDTYSVVLVSGTTIITLPTSVGRSSKQFLIKKTDASNTITINTTSSQTIDGQTSRSLSNQYDSLVLLSDGTNWNILYSNLSISGWTPLVEAWAYASATTITVPSGATARFQVGDKIKLTNNSTVKYFYIIGVASTTLTVTGGSDYSLENASITDISYSRSERPFGFPDFFNFAMTSPDMSPVPSGGVCKFSMKGKMVTAIISQPTNGTGTLSPQLRIGAPIAGNSTSGYISLVAAYGVDGSTNYVACFAEMRWDTNTYFRVYRADAPTGENWTVSVARNAIFTISYEV